MLGLHVREIPLQVIKVVQIGPGDFIGWNALKLGEKLNIGRRFIARDDLVFQVLFGLIPDDVGSSQSNIFGIDNRFIFHQFFVLIVIIDILVTKKVVVVETLRDHLRQLLFHL